MVSHRSICAVLVACSASQAAFAQDAQPDDVYQPQTVSETRATPATAPAGEIIVTARRRSESLQDTPVAVTAITTEQLESFGSTDITDLQGQAPNTLITTQSTGAATANISIRGIAFADVEKSFDPAVGVNVDGVYIGTSTGQLLDFFDIESIEILRGPQGTLFGRNTIAGVINVRRTKPTGEFGGKVEASMGSYGRFGLRAVLNVPLVDDVLALKLFEMHDENTGFLKDAATGKRVGGSNSENFGASLLYTPNADFEALLTVEQQDQDFDPRQGTLIRPGDVFCGAVPAGACGRNNTDDIYTVFDPGYQPFGDYRARAATLELNYDAGFTELASVTSYRESDELQRQDFGTAGNFDTLRDQEYWQFSQELRAAGDLFEGLDYVVGAYFFKSRYNLFQETGVFAPRAPGQDTTGKSESYAGFFDLNLEVTPTIRISGGGRLTHDKKSLANALIADPNGNFGISAEDDWTQFTPKLGVDWRPTDSLMLYESWSRGYRSGGFSGRAVQFTAATTPYDPEKVDAYEIGLKSDFFDRMVTFNLAAFYTDYKDIQQSTTVLAPGTVQGQATIVRNGEGAKIKGIEADLTVRPLTGLTLRGALGYTDAEFKNFVIGTPVGATVRQFDLSDVNLIYAPEYTISVSGDYTAPIGAGDLTLSSSFRYLAPYDQQIVADPATPIPATGIIDVDRNDPRVRSDKQYLVDASISYAWDIGPDGERVKVTAFGRNLLDDRGTATAFTAGAFPTLFGFTAAREPRVFGGRIGFEF